LHDFAVAAARMHEATPKSSRGRYGAGLAPAVLRAEAAGDRWYDEGGNIQTRVARRAYKAYA
jgi:hypothetical protein